MCLSQALTRCKKSQIEKRNMESTSWVSRKEKRNVEICFLVREENENFCKKNGEILIFSPVSRWEEKSKNIFSSFEKRKRNFANKSHDSRGDRDVEISNFSWREREIHLPPFTFLFLFYFSSVLKTKKYLRHREEFWRPIPEQRFCFGEYYHLSAFADWS